MEFVGDGVLLGKNGIEMTDESSVSGGVSGKICSVRTSKNANGEITSNASRLAGKVGETSGGEDGGGNASSTGRLREVSRFS